MRRSNRGELGFTITELLVALTVTVIGLAGLLSLHVTTVRGNASAAEAAEAMNVAEQTLEDHRGLTVKAIDALYQPNAPPVNDDWPIGSTDEAHVTLVPHTGRNNRLYHRRLFAQEVTGQPNLIRFRVEVFWSDDGAVPTDLNDSSTGDHRIGLQMVRTRVEVF